MRRRWFRDKAPRQRMEGLKGLRPCPNCGRMNGWLQRGARDVCAYGVGCNHRDDGGPFRAR